MECLGFFCCLRLGLVGFLPLISTDFSTVKGPFYWVTVP